MKCSKCLLIFINVLYLIISVLVVAGGTIAKVTLGNYNFLDDGVSIFSTLWIVTGCSLLLIAVLGVIIAFGDSIILTHLYAITLSAIVLLQLAAAVAGFSISVCKSKEIISDTITSLIETYDNNDTSREAIDWMQSKYQCCGGKSPEDWNNLRYSSVTVSPTEQAITSQPIPVSCCTRELVENNSNCSSFYKTGCLDQIHLIVSNHVTIISISALIIAAVQMIGVFGAYLHIKAIRSSRKLDEIDYSQLNTKEHNFY